MAVWSTPTWATGNALNQSNFNTKVANNLTYLHDLLTSNPLDLTTSGKAGVNVSPLNTLHVRDTGSGNPAIRLDDSGASGDHWKVVKFDASVRYLLTHDDGNAHHDVDSSPVSSTGNAYLRLWRGSTIDGNSGLEIYAADGTTTTDYRFPTSTDGRDVLMGAQGGINFAMGRGTASATLHVDSGSGDASFRLHRAGNTNQFLQINRSATETDYRSFTASDAYLQWNGILDGNNNSDAVYYEFGNDSLVHGSGAQAFRLYDGHASSPSIDTQISMHASGVTYFHSTNTARPIGWWTEPAVAWHMAGGKRALYTIDEGFTAADSAYQQTLQFSIGASDELNLRYYRANGDYRDTTLINSGGWTTP